MQLLRVYDGKMLVQPDSMLHASDFSTGEASRGLLGVQGQPQGHWGFKASPDYMKTLSWDSKRCRLPEDAFLHSLSRALQKTEVGSEPRAMVAIAWLHPSALKDEAKTWIVGGDRWEKEQEYSLREGETEGNRNL